MSEDLTKQDLKASEERIVKLIGDIAARSDERFAKVIAKSDERFAAMQQRFAASDERFAAMEQKLRRILVIGVREARRERRFRRELDENTSRGLAPPSS
jgi:hypothetical protein